MDASDGAMRIEIVARAALTPARYAEAVTLCDRAYADDDDIAEVMAEFADATHVMLLDPGDRLVSHALWVERTLVNGTARLRCAYVELVATDPDHRLRGYASTVMHALGDAIAGFDMGALSPSDPAFYARFGWATWRGPLFERDRDGRTTRSPADETVMVFPRRGAALDLDGPLTAPWRRGEIW